MQLTPFTRYSLLLFAGPLVWAVHFLAIYGFAGVVCARPALQQVQWLGFGLLAWGVLVCGLLAMAVLAAAMLALPGRSADHGTSFLRQVSAGLAGLTVVAIAWESASVLFFPACAGAA